MSPSGPKANSSDPTTITGGTRGYLLEELTEIFLEQVLSFVKELVSLDQL